MFGRKINVQQELDSLVVEEQNIRNKCGRRFNQLYNTIVESIAGNARIIDTARRANKDLDGELTEVISAMETINYEVE